jgi:hypothetical protein
MTTTETTTPKYRTITLTDRAPVCVREDLWPIVAKARGDSRTQHHTPVPDYEIDSYYLTVRQHTDGRAIVHGRLDASTAWTGSEGRAGGEMVAAIQDPTRATGVTMPDLSEIARVIRRVGEECGLPDRVIRECIADLPAVDVE